MTQEDIIRMAREAGFADDKGVVHPAYQLEAFAALVAAAICEECAAMFDNHNVWDEEVGERIRARGNT
jgi:hypothetical protein